MLWAFDGLISLSEMSRSSTLSDAPLAYATPSTVHVSHFPLCLVVPTATEDCRRNRSCWLVLPHSAKRRVPHVSVWCPFSKAHFCDRGRLYPSFAACSPLA